MNGHNTDKEPPMTTATEIECVELLDSIASIVQKLRSMPLGVEEWDDLRHAKTMLEDVLASSEGEVLEHQNRVEKLLTRCYLAPPLNLL
jgi:hypothetical protein